MNLSKQNILIQRIKENGTIWRPVYKYEFRLDGKYLNFFHTTRRLSEWDEAVYKEEYARIHYLDASKIKIERVKNQLKMVRIPHLGRAS